MGKNAYRFSSHPYVRSLFYDYVNYVLPSTNPNYSYVSTKIGKGTFRE